MLKNMKYRELNNPSMAFYSMNGCPHCVRALPEFELGTRNSGINTVVHENTTHMGLKAINDAGVTSFPTILGKNKNGVHKYNGDRSAESFAEFARFLKA